MIANLHEVSRVIGAACDPPPTKVTGWSVDSRTQNPGDLYFALRGPNHDGHDYVAAALANGAAGAVVEEGGADPLIRGRRPRRPLGQETDADFPTEGGSRGTRADQGVRPTDPRELVVRDSLRALQELGAWARLKWGGRVIGVTGSAGKTTTKDAIAHLLAVALPVGKTVGNFNNHVGVPLSILRLPDDCRAAVLEIGMNHAGEVRELAAIARPEVGVVTNVGYAHVEFFESIDGVAAAKRELIEALPRDGVAVLNADDERVLAFRRAHAGRSVTFGFSEAADLRAEPVEFTEEGSRFRAAGVDFETALPGRHTVMNLLAAIAVAGVFGIAPEKLRDAVRSFAGGKMRGERTEHNGVVVWNDCYNSNPEAARSMIDVLAATPAARRIAVLGEMLELGRAAGELHRAVGRYAAERGIDLLVAVRGCGRAIVEGAREAGLADGAARFFEDAAAAGDYVREAARPGDAILFKGSRGVRMERALERFLM